MAKKEHGSVLVTGAGGFLGRALSRRLAESDSKLVLASRSQLSDISSATCMVGDLNDPAYCEKILEGIDVVYYAAGFKKNIAVHTGRPFDALTGNVGPLLTFLAAAKRSRIRTLVYMSSSIVEYASDSDATFDGYVWGKYINEIVVRSFAKEVDVDVKIIRSAPLYGPGDNMDPATANFIPSFIRRVFESDTSVVVWGSGERVLQFIYIDDLVANVRAACESADSFFVFGNPERATVNTVAAQIIALSGRVLAVEHDLSKPDKSTKLSTFKNLVPPQFDMAKGLKATVAYYKEYHA
jgi:nucleoside-diphosphate-sugar epimerase